MVKEVKLETSKIIRIFTTEDLFRNLLNLIKDNAEKLNIKVIKTQSKIKGKTPPFITMEPTKEKNQSEYVALGAELESFKYRAASEIQIEAAKKKKAEVNYIRLGFDSKVANEFKQLHGESLRLHKIIGRQGTVEFQFDVTDCLNRTQLIKRVLLITDAVEDIKRNKRHARNKHELDSTVDYLSKNCHGITQNTIVYEEMTGKEAIARGYTNRWDIDSHYANNIEKIFAWAFGKKKSKDYFMGSEVQEEEKYMVKLRKPKKVDQPMDFREEVWKRYVYGEQVYYGLGMELVHRFQKQIIESYNEVLKRQK